MPEQNRFHHQQYRIEAPTSPHHLLAAPSCPSVGSPEFATRMQQVGKLLHDADVAAIYLIHGTFVGNDPLGIFDEIARSPHRIHKLLPKLGKRLTDRIVGEAGNYTKQYAQTLAESLRAAGQRPIPVRLFHWSGQNNHIGRADAAVALLDEIATQQFSPNRRVLLWGHSHGGNVLAIVSNLLAADPALREKFFTAAEVFYRRPVMGGCNKLYWERTRKLLQSAGNPLANIRLDVVTFGTPIRYGWDSAGYAQLLHFVNHRPASGMPTYLAPFPQSQEEIRTAAYGDYVQLLGIAGTNFAPGLLSWRSWLADLRLNRLIQSGIRKRELLRRLQVGMRVAQQGTTLLVDYGPAQGSTAQHLAGHAIYTRSEQMLFHAEQIASRFY